MLSHCLVSFPTFTHSVCCQQTPRPVGSWVNQASKTRHPQRATGGLRRDDIRPPPATRPDPSGLLIDARGRVLYPDAQVEYVDAEGRTGHINIEGRPRQLPQPSHPSKGSRRVPASRQRTGCGEHPPETWPGRRYRSFLTPGSGRPRPRPLSNSDTRENTVIMHFLQNPHSYALSAQQYTDPLNNIQAHTRPVLNCIIIR